MDRKALSEKEHLSRDLKYKRSHNQRIQKKDFQAWGTANTKDLGWEDVGENRSIKEGSVAGLSDGSRCINSIYSCTDSNTHTHTHTHTHTVYKPASPPQNFFILNVFNIPFLLTALCGAGRDPEQVGEVCVLIPLKS